MGAAGLALLPLYSAQHDHPVPPGGWIEWLPRSERLLAVPQHFVVGLSVPWRALGPLVGIGLAVAVGYALSRADRSTLRGFGVAGGIAAAGIVLALIPMFLGNDYLITRNLLELWLPLAIAVAIALGSRAIGMVGPAVVVALCVIGVALAFWNAATPEARRVDWDQLSRAIGEPQQVRVIGAPGAIEGVPLSLQLPGSHVAKPEENLAASELVLLTMRPVKNYAIGPCVWGADCGGSVLGGPNPPFVPPPQFRLVRQGTTPRLAFRIYRAERPVPLPGPANSAQRNIVVQEPG